MMGEEPWVELEYCGKHEFEAVPCRDCRIEELESGLNTSMGAVEVLSKDAVKLEAQLDEVRECVEPLNEWYDKKTFDSAMEKLQAILEKEDG